MKSTPEKLPVLALWSDVLRQMIRHRAELFSISLPLLSLITIFIAAHKLYPYSDDSVTEGILVLAVMLLFIVLTVLAAVRCHNLFIRGPDTLQNLGLFRSIGTEESYALNFVLVGFCASMVGMIFSIPLFISGTALTKLFAVESSDVLPPMYFGSQALILYVGTRYSLLLPAVATGNKRMGLGLAWRMSAGNSLSLFVAVNSVLLLVHVLCTFIPDNHLVLKVVQMILHGGAAFWGVAVLSVSYHYLSGALPTDKPA